MCAARWNQIVNEAAIIQEAEEGGNEGIFIQDKEEKERWIISQHKARLRYKINLNFNQYVRIVRRFHSISLIEQKRVFFTEFFHSA